MDMVHSSGIFASAEIQMINYVHLYLQVTTISDITQMDGKTLQIPTRLGKPGHLSSQSKWLYPIQPRPSHQAWTLWLKVLDKIMAPGGQLLAPLGRWVDTANKLSRTWNSY